MVGHAVEYAGPAIEALSMPGRMTICNMTIEGGGRAGMIAPDETTFEWIRGRPGAPEDFDAAVESWRSLPTERRRRLRHRGRGRRRLALADGHLGHDTRDGGRGHRLGARSRLAREGPVDPETARRALAYMDLEPGTPIDEITLDRVFIGSCTNSRIEDLREAAESSRAARSRDRVRAMVVPGSQQVKAEAEAEGLDEVFRAAGFEWREAGCSMCLGMNPDILDAGRALRLDLEPQLRGPPGQGRAHPPGQPEDGRRGRGRGPLRRHSGLELR